MRQAQLEPTGLVHDEQRMVLAPEAGEPVLIRGGVLAVVAMELRYFVVRGHH